MGVVPLQDHMKLIPIDDHLIEHPNVWQDRIPEKFKEPGLASTRPTTNTRCGCTRGLSTRRSVPTPCPGRTPRTTAWTRPLL